MKTLTGIWIAACIFNVVKIVVYGGLLYAAVVLLSLHGVDNDNKLYKVC